MMLIVLDTNIFISAQITPKSNAGKILGEWELGNLEIAKKYLHILKYKNIWY
jgi:predicted nucleic acid-binding protein